MNTKATNAPMRASPTSFTRNYPYGTSISSSASSSTSSIFSAADDRSSQSSGSASPSPSKATLNTNWETVSISSSPLGAAQQSVQNIPPTVAPASTTRSECPYISTAAELVRIQLAMAPPVHHAQDHRHHSLGRVTGRTTSSRILLVSSCPLFR